MTVLIGATVPPYPGPNTTAWLENARREPSLLWFAALEVDGRGVDVHRDVTRRLGKLGGDWWTFAVDCGEDELTTANRLHRICMGRNLIIERAMRDPSVTHVLFLDADLVVPANAVHRLLALPSHPVVGGHVPAYCLDGPRVTLPDLPDADVRAHWNTAGFILVRRDVLNRVHWGHAAWDEGITDDPWFQDRVRDLFGTETWVRHDVLGRHIPLVPLEARGYDRRYVRV